MVRQADDEFSQLRMYDSRVDLGKRGVHLAAGSRLAAQLPWSSPAAMPSEHGECVVEPSLPCCRFYVIHSPLNRAAIRVGPGRSRKWQAVP